MRICELGGESKALFPWLAWNELDIGALRALIYGVVLIYFFLGVAIISDNFMAGIEAITGRRKQQVNEDGSRSTSMVWNETVATLSLMALGSSAPEIALSCVDLIKKGFHFSDLGPATIVGSAAFNLLVIIAVCIVVIPSTETRVVAELPAFYITAIFSLFAYVWLAIILAFTSADRVDIWEAAATFMLLPILIWVSYKFDVGDAQRSWAKLLGKTVEEETEADGAEDSSSIFIKFDGKTYLEIKGGESEQTLEVKVTLSVTELFEPVKCKFRAEGLTAVDGVDFELEEGELEFPAGHVKPLILDVKILEKSESTADCAFIVILEEAEGAEFDPKTDGDEEAVILTANILARTAGDHTLDRLIRFSSIKKGLEEWKSQYADAIFCGGSWEEHKEAEWNDKILHFMALPWKLIFAIVPPTDFFGGWLCFWGSLMFIGLMTAFISDIAELFGCVIGVPDIVTALSFVALGTSMPDLFASLSAAKEDPTADASIVNVTGSNSVNVFLGLGLPWTVGAIYWTITGRTPEWEAKYVNNPLFKTNFKGAGFMVESGNIVFTVWVFCCACVAALLLLHLRRKWLGCELGGPWKPKIFTSITLVAFWVSFVAVTSWRSMRWQVMSNSELIQVVGGIGFLNFLLLVGSVVLTYKSKGEVVAPSEEPQKVWAPAPDTQPSPVASINSGQGTFSNSPCSSQGVPHRPHHLGQHGPRALERAHNVISKGLRDVGDKLVGTSERDQTPTPNNRQDQRKSDTVPERPAVVPQLEEGAPGAEAPKAEEATAPPGREEWKSTEALEFI